jgi:hypothetical protein
MRYIFKTIFYPVATEKIFMSYPDFFATAGERGAPVKGLPRLYPERALKNTGFLVAQQSA